MADGTDDGSSFWDSFMNASGDTGGQSGTDDYSWLMNQGQLPISDQAKQIGYTTNPDGTFTDPQTGIVYGQDGTPIDQIDPQTGQSIGATTGNDTNNLSGPSAPGDGSDIMKMLGGIPGLAGLLAPLLGGLYAAHQTNKATGQVLGGINNANTAIQSILGGGKNLYAPYMQAGQSALNQMQGPSLFAPWTQGGQAAMGRLNNMNWQPLNYGALGGTPQQAAPNMMTLGNLARRIR